MAYSLIGNVGTNGASTFTTAAIDTTGANFLVAHFTKYQAGGAHTLSDSKGNIWTPRTAKTGTVAYSIIYYVASPIVGTGHTFTITGTNFYGTLEVQAWSGASGSPYDVENGATGTGASLATGSVTPSQNNSLIIAGVCPTDNSSGTITVDLGFTITDQFAWAVNVNEGGAMAYLVLATAAAKNPTFSWTGSVDCAATIAVFGSASSYPVAWIKA